MNKKITLIWCHGYWWRMEVSGWKNTNILILLINSHFCTYIRQLKMYLSVPSFMGSPSYYESSSGDHEYLVIYWSKQPTNIWLLSAVGMDTTHSRVKWLRGVLIGFGSDRLWWKKTLGEHANWAGQGGERASQGQSWHSTQVTGFHRYVYVWHLVSSISQNLLVEGWGIGQGRTH